MRRVYFIGNWFAINNELFPLLKGVFRRCCNETSLKMANLEYKSDPLHSWDTIRQVLDVIRHLIIVTSTVVIVYLIWNIYWFLALVAAIPAYILLLNLFGFLTLPLYGLIAYAWSSLTPEGKGMSQMWKRVEKGETEALRELAKRTGKEH
jgi:hypothetical protein